jgi:hypothetical protein
MALLVAGGPFLGGPFALAHTSLHDMLTGDDRPPIDLAANNAAALPARYVSPQTTPNLLPVSPVTSTIAWFGQPAPIPGEPCAAFHFHGRVYVRGDRISFGRLNMVRDTSPYGKSDPLAFWKVLQFESLTFARADMAAQADALVTSLPVNQVVNLLITDPYTQIPLLSAKWQVKTVEILSKQAGINATLEDNLSDIRVNNAIESDTLSCFASDQVGVIVMRFQHTEDIVPLIESGRPVAATMSGTAHVQRCVK